MRVKTFLLFGISIFTAAAARAQSAEDETIESPTRINILKLNLTALPLKNYSFQYESTFSSKASFTVAFRTMPVTTLPFQNTILKQVNDGDSNTQKTLHTFELANYAITPQVRFYLGKKGAGQGFYIGPFYRYASYKTNTLNFHYNNNGTQETISLSGKLTSNTGGIAIGAQWFLGRHWSLDWWILGPHYGAGRGNFKGLSTYTLTPQEQSDLRQQLQDLNIPFTRKTVNVTSNSASLDLRGPWGGVLAGLLLGFRF